VALSCLANFWLDTNLPLPEEPQVWSNTVRLRDRVCGRAVIGAEGAADTASIEGTRRYHTSGFDSNLDDRGPETAVVDRAAETGDATAADECVAAASPALADVPESHRRAATLGVVQLES